MARFDDAWDQEDADDLEEFHLLFDQDESHGRFWSERRTQVTDAAPSDLVPALFSDRYAEAELRNEIRLSELWRRGQMGLITSQEFHELCALITEVDGIRGSLCTECTMLDRPNVSANWALGNTMLCRGHLRFHLGHVEVAGEGGRRNS